MLKKIIIIISLIPILLFGISGTFLYFSLDSPNGFLSPKGNINEGKNNKLINSIFKKKDTLSVLVLGTDTSASRRSNGQRGYNTDTMILISVNTKTNRVLLTSVPRDYWINGNKINALYTVYGWETLKSAFEKITGLEVDGYIRADFDALRWIVDSFGGIPVNVERTFTDNNFPNNNDSGVIPVTFTEGLEIMPGQRALTFTRSRKGNNGEGSDLMRAKRQHLILQGMIEAVSQPKSIFWPMDIPKFFGAITKRMDTTLTLDDVYYIWDFYKDKDEYTVESFVIDGEYVYHPGRYPQSSYRTWVFIPKDGALSRLHRDIKDKLSGTFEEPTVAGHSQNDQFKPPQEP